MYQMYHYFRLLQMYQCTTPMLELSPLLYYRAFGTDLWACGVSGGHIYAYDVTQGDSFDNDDSPRDQHTDMAMIYRGQRGPIGSRRWEAVREGIEDCIYLHMADGHFRKTGAREAAQSRLRELAAVIATATDEDAAAPAVRDMRRMVFGLLDPGM